MKRLHQWLREIQIPIWLASVIIHLGGIALSMRFVLEPPIKRSALLETQLSQIIEDNQLDRPEIEPLPLQPSQSFEANKIDPSAPVVMSAIAPNPITASATLSNLDLPPIDNVAKLLEGNNPAGVAAKGIGGSLDSRSAGMKESLLASEGGTQRTERSVNAGLIWFVNHQFPEGRWSLQYRKDSPRFPGVVKSDVAATGLALLPFLASNHTPKNGQHRQAVAKGIAWLLKQQLDDGKFVAKGDQGAIMYAHPLATIAICETYGLTKEPRLKAPAERALKFIMATQNRAYGWRYSEQSVDADTSVFGWNIMALKSGSMAGLHVPEEVFNKCRKYLDSAAVEGKKHLYYYDPGAKLMGNTPGMTAIGILSRQYLGAKRHDPTVVAGINYLTEDRPPDKFVNIYYWYYGTQAVHNYQGPKWDQWNRSIRRIWIETQDRDPKSKDFGSWDPEKVSTGNDHAINIAGRLYVTSIGLLQLTVYYRYLPVYQLQETKSAATGE